MVKEKGQENLKTVKAFPRKERTNGAVNMRIWTVRQARLQRITYYTAAANSVPGADLARYWLQKNMEELESAITTFRVE